MTTSTFYGIATEVDPSTGDIITATAASFSFVGADNVTGFSYRIITPASPSQPLPEVEFTSANPYSILFNGVPGSEAELAGLSVYIGEINWGAGNTTYFMNIVFNATDQFIVQLGGDAIPLNGLSTPAEIEAWQATWTGGGAVTSGIFVAGTTIPFSSVLDLTSSPHDTILGTSGADYIHAGSGKDTIDGGLGNDRIWGDGGKDRISGGEGDDKIYGGDGKDQIQGGDGDDRLIGGAGNDSMIGDAGADTVAGGDGDDRLAGGAGVDTIYGGKGNDKIDGGSESDLIYGGKGDDQIYGGTGGDTILGGKGNDQIAGADGDDGLVGDKGNDRLDGGKGNDWLFGGDGNDILNGNKGNDIISGGVGNDIMSGGKGADEFNFNETSFGNDTILDFDMATDTIYLGGFLGSNPGVTFTNATDLVSTYASVVGGNVVFDFGTGDTITLTGLTTTLGLDAFLNTDIL